MRRGANCNVTHAADTVSLRTLGKFWAKNQTRKGKQGRKLRTRGMEEDRTTNDRTTTAIPRKMNDPLQVTSHILNICLCSIWLALQTTTADTVSFKEIAGNFLTSYLTTICTLHTFSSSSVLNTPVCTARSVNLRRCLVDCRDGGRR